MSEACIHAVVHHVALMVNMCRQQMAACKQMACSPAATVEVLNPGLL